MLKKVNNSVINPMCLDNYLATVDYKCWINKSKKPNLGDKRMSMYSEFKEFALKGNVIDLAVGVIIGAAFGKIVDSLVKDIIMPIVGSISGNLDFSSMYVVLGEMPADTANNLAAIKEAGVPVLAYGSFITVTINFIILAFIIFQMVRAVNKIKRAEPAAAPEAPAADIVLLTEIRDALKKN